MVTEGAAPVPDLCWPLDPACLGDTWNNYSLETQDRAAFLAVSTLRLLTAFRVGGCPITVRPCQPSCCIPGVPYAYDSFGQPFFPTNWAGVWTNCGCRGTCQCKAACEVRLPAPIGDLIEVKSNGVVLDNTDFRVDNSNILVYQGTGECPFDMAQDLSLADTEVGTWSVTYLNAYKPSALASYAAGILAVEFAKACDGAKCRLPAGVTEIARAGVRMEVTAGNFPGGFTGIKEVDSFIALYNPYGSKKRPLKVWSPGTPQYRHTTLSGS